MLQVFDFNKLKLVATLVVFWITLHNIHSDRNSCTRLLESGHYAGATWQPSGCLLYMYTRSDVSTCFLHRAARQNRKLRLTFVGDSRVRQQFTTLRDFLTGDYTPLTHVHHDMQYTTTHTLLQFKWKPIAEYLILYYSSLRTLPKEQTPDFILTGFATHHMQRYSRSRTVKQSLDLYSRFVTILGNYFTFYSNVTEVLWMLQDPLNTSTIRARLGRGKRLYMTDHLVDEYNERADHILSRSPVTIWKSNREIARRYLHETHHDDGIHNGNKTLFWQMQELLNYLCNRDMGELESETRESEISESETRESEISESETRESETRESDMLQSKRGYCCVRGPGVTVTQWWVWFIASTVSVVTDYILHVHTLNQDN